MSKKHFIALADAIREHNKFTKTMGNAACPFTYPQIKELARFCKAQNSNFNEDRWLAYITGKCGPNGGAR
jgi:hypothetical protein